MTERWEQECAALRAELAALRQQMLVLQTAQASPHVSIPRRPRWPSRRLIAVLLPAVVLFVAGGVLYGHAAMDALFVDQQGRVGIGTTAPAETLHVSGGNIQLDGDRQLKFTDADTTNKLKLQLWQGYGLGINGGTLFYTANGKHSWRHSDGKTESMALTTNADGTGALTVTGTGPSSFAGSLGIGAPPAPNSKLDVRGPALLHQLMFADASGKAYPDNWIGMADNVDAEKTKWLHIGGITDGGKRRLTLIANTTYLAGDIGIGTSKPSAALDVVGDIKATTIRGEKPPVRFDVGQFGTWGSVEKEQEIRDYCADGDGCTMKFFLRYKSGQARTTSAFFYINGFRGARTDINGRLYDFILNDRTKAYNDIFEWDGRIWIRNRASRSDAGMVDPPYQGYKLNFMTHPDNVATVIIYDR